MGGSASRLSYSWGLDVAGFGGAEEVLDGGLWGDMPAPCL